MSESVTVTDLQSFCVEILEKRKECDDADEIAKRIGKELSTLENSLIATMVALELKSFPNSGMLFGIRETMQLATPKGEDKEKFFEYLKHVGHFEALATVHARTLASWYNQENEAAVLRGEPYAMIPGLELPTKRLGLSVTKTKRT